MTSTRNLLTRVCDAQTRNSTLAATELRDAARTLAAIATDGGWALLGVDAAGERLIGAALIADDRVRLVDASRRLDGLSVLLVAGHIAGPTGIAMKATLALSLGATRVEATVLGPCSTASGSGQRVVSLDRERHLVAL
jgi:hypothetical protein